MKTTFPTVALYDRDGNEIASQECQGMKDARQRARHYLSDLFAETSETTHANLRTMKAAIFAEGARTGADAVCEWDEFHPQHAAWVQAEDEKAAREEQTRDAQADGY